MEVVFLDGSFCKLGILMKPIWKSKNIKITSGAHVWVFWYLKCCAKWIAADILNVSSASEQKEKKLIKSSIFEHALSTIAFQFVPMFAVNYFLCVRIFWPCWFVGNLDLKKRPIILCARSMLRSREQSVRRRPSRENMWKTWKVCLFNSQSNKIIKHGQHICVRNSQGAQRFVDFFFSIVLFGCWLAGQANSDHVILRYKCVTVDIYA